MQVARRRGIRHGRDRRHRRHDLLAALAAGLAGEAELLEAGDLALALDAGGVVRGEAVDELGDAVAQLEREVGGRGTHQLAHVLDADLAADAFRMFGLAHRPQATASSWSASCWSSSALSTWLSSSTWSSSMWSWSAWSWSAPAPSC